MMLPLFIAAGLALPTFLLWLAASYYIWHEQERLIYPGDGLPFGTHPALKELGITPCMAEREGQKLRWYFKAAEKPRALVLVFHGNRFGAAERFDFVSALVPEGISVALVEYPGYAGDPVRGSEWPLLRNALAAWDEITASASGLPIFLAGESLGTGVATFLATRRRPQGLILASPYLSMGHVAKFRYPMLPIHQMILHPIDAWRWAPHVACPVLCIHGTEDRTIPYSLGLRQSRNFKRLEAFLSIRGAGHGDLRSFDGGAFWKAALAFIGRWA